MARSYRPRAARLRMSWRAYLASGAPGIFGVYRIHDFAACACLVRPLFSPLSLMSPIFLPLILPLEPCILILLVCASHEGTGERARTVKSQPRLGGSFGGVRSLRPIVPVSARSVSGRFAGRPSRAAPHKVFGLLQPWRTASDDPDPTSRKDAYGGLDDRHEVGPCDGRRPRVTGLRVIISYII
jgi:hypothetical protein